MDPDPEGRRCAPLSAAGSGASFAASSAAVLSSLVVTVTRMPVRSLTLRH